MRTRNSGNPKPAPPPKKTPPSRRSTPKTTPIPPPETDVTTTSHVENANPSGDDVEVTPETKATRGGKTRSSTRKAVARTKTPTSARAASRRTPKSDGTKKVKVEETPEEDEGEDHRDEESVQKEESSENITEESRKEAEPEKKEVGDHIDGESVKKEEASEIIAEKSMTHVEPAIENAVVTEKEGFRVLNIEETSKMKEKSGGMEQPLVTDAGKSSGQEEDALGTKEEENVIDPEPEEDLVENDETIDQQQEEKTTHTVEPSVMDAGKSSGRDEDALGTKENAIDPEPEEDQEEDEDTIEQQQEEKTLDHSFMDVEASSIIEEKTLEKEKHLKAVKDTISTEQPLDQNVMDVEEPMKVEEKTPWKEENLAETVTNLEEPFKTVEDTINTERLLDHNVMNVKELTKVEEKTPKKEENLGETVTNCEEPLKTDVDITNTEQAQVSNDFEGTSQEKIQEFNIGKDDGVVKEEMDEEMKTLVDKVGPDNEPINMEEDVMEEDVNQVSKEKDAQVVDESPRKEKLKETGGKVIVDELKEDEDDVQEHVDAADSLEVERTELNAAAKERKLRKELEIFVGGLDHDATEDDLKKAFENVGEIIEVRLLKDSSNKNKGYAFVEFATKELARQALIEMKSPLIRGKQCRTAPSENNDMLFLGNICNTWTKEAIKQKLKDYSIESVENINVIPDARNEGLSRGFAFLEFSCHADAMQAYKRLQKPDVIFGHTERTAKVAFTEPVCEPDPEVMAQVKTVFVDGLPQWTEDKVREKLKGYGEIVRITLSRNMSTAKRKDYGFVDFTTHEAAVACIEGINSENSVEGNSKWKVRARLLNPLPRAQPVKGGMCGGFRIGRGGGATSSSRSGRGFGLGGHAFNRQNCQHDRGFYLHGRGQTGRVGFTREHDVHMQYPPFQRREMFGRGAWRDHFVAPCDSFVGGPTPFRPPLDMSRHDVAADRGHGRQSPNSRLPFPPEEGYHGHVMRRQMDEPYIYDGRTSGIKRPFPMTELDYMDRSRLRPRMDYSDPAGPYRAPGYRDNFGPDRNPRSHDYYGRDYREGPRPAFYGNVRPYGGGYPPRY